MVPGRLGGDLWRRLAALLAADPLEGVRREDDRRRPATDVAVPILPRCKKERENAGSIFGGKSQKVLRYQYHSAERDQVRIRLKFHKGNNIVTMKCSILALASNQHACVSVLSGTFIARKEK